MNEDIAELKKKIEGLDKNHSTMATFLDAEAKNIAALRAAVDKLSQRVLALEMQGTKTVVAQGMTHEVEILQKLDMLKGAILEITSGMTPSASMRVTKHLW